MTKHKFYSPLLLPLIGFIAGAYLQTRVNAPISQLIYGILITSTLIGIMLLVKKVAYTKIISLPLFVCLGSCLVTLQKTEHATTLALLQGQPLNVYATVIDKGMWGEWHNKHWIRITIHEAYFPKTNNHCHMTFDLLCYFAYKTRVSVSDTISIQNVIVKATNTKNRTDNASYQDYLVKEGILSSLFLTGANKCTITHRPDWSLKRWLWNMRNKTYQTMRKKLSPTAFTYMGLMFLGNKEHNNMQQLRTTFNQWGLAHYLARSGLHIVLFIIIWTFLFGFIPVHITIKRVLLVLICLVYDILSWVSIPFARALYVFLLIKGGQFTGQQTNFLHLLTCVCFGVLLFNPMQLFFLDFQLTFALTFTLVLSAPFISNAAHKTT